MMSLTSSSTTSRQQRELRATALMEKLRRQTGVPVGQMDLLTWTLVHRRMLKPDLPFDLTNHMYLREIHAVQARKMVIHKASQMGASEYAVSYSLHAADERQATVLYVFPTDTHVSDFSTARFGPAIEASDYLDSIVIEGGAAAKDGERKQRGADRVTLKRIRERFLYLRGGQVKPNGQAPQLKSVDADVVILDEVDEMDPRAPSIAEKRLGHSELAELRYISTPTYPEQGIHARWLESDQREWYVPCPHCHEWQPMTIDQVVLEWDSLKRPVAWNGQAEGRAWVACRKCGGELNRLADGVWVPAFPGQEMVGFHLTKLFSSRARLLDIVTALQTTDETKRREAFNQDLGETYVPSGGQMTGGILDNCRRDYGYGPIEDEKTVMGADVGKVIHAVVRGPKHPETGEHPQRWAGAVDSFDELGHLMQRYNVQTAVIDALPETTMARKLQATLRRAEHWVLWLAYYVNQKAGTKSEDPAQWDRDNGVVNLDRTRTLDGAYARFYDQTATLPANARSVPDLYAHLMAPIRILEDGPGGQKVVRYVEAKPDHLAHAENYCLVAESAPRLPAVRLSFF